MRLSTVILAYLSGLALAQRPPFPTASIGCIPHDDHWHCEGPAPAAPPQPAQTQAPAAAASLAGPLPPKPTESTGCEPHGDHWHCDAPASNSASHSSAAGHGDAPGTAVLPPSPTASAGCEPHGDHWHCDGPKSTSTSSYYSAAQFTGAANRLGGGVVGGGVGVLAYLLI